MILTHLRSTRICCGTGRLFSTVLSATAQMPNRYSAAVCASHTIPQAAVACVELLSQTVETIFSLLRSFSSTVSNRIAN